jgi:hypothetical protein
MSKVLIGSISSFSPALSSSAAANFKLATKVRRSSASATPAGALPARQFSCGTPSALA